MSGDGRVVLRAGAATHVGRLRPNNQDSYALLPEQGIYVVADGMGGAQGGEVASRMAIETIAESYTEPSIDALEQVIAEANERIHAASERPNLRGMGTTTVAIALIPDEPDGRHVNGDRDAGDLELAEQLLVVNVGDSRAYLFRDGALTQLTDDHSVVAELVRDGRITAVEAEAHPQRNIITRVLGVYPEVTPDIWPVDPIRGDRYLLCSDGLFNEVSDDQMSSVLRRLSDPTDAANELVRLANEGGGRDNITVIVLDVIDDGGAAERASAALAGEERGSSRAADPDLAGFSTAIGEHRSGTPKGGPRGKRKAKSTRGEAAPSLFRRVRSRVTWRVLVFTLMLAAVIGGAFATIQWYGTSTYYVGFHGDEVAIYQGRPGGLLWIDPTLEQDTAIKRDEVPVLYLTALEAGREHSSLADAKAYVSRIERDIIERDERATTTTTTAPPTTAAPPSTAAN